MPNAPSPPSFPDSVVPVCAAREAVERYCPQALEGGQSARGVIGEMRRKVAGFSLSRHRDDLAGPFQCRRYSKAARQGQTGYFASLLVAAHFAHRKSFALASVFQLIVTAKVRRPSWRFRTHNLPEQTNRTFKAKNSGCRASGLHAYPYLTLPARMCGRCDGVA
jgi:hypothetical protein